MNISVCMATYNGEKFINEQLKSILLQIDQNDEVIISDDSSTDNPIAIIESFDDNRIKILKGNPGFIKNLIKNSYLGCCMAFDRKILNAALPFPKGIAMHDIWIGLISEICGKSIFINDKLVSYRRHGLNFSPTSQKSKFSFHFKLYYRLIFLYHVILRFIQIKF